MSLIRSIVKAVLPPPLTIRLRAVFKKHEPERDLLPALCDPTRGALDIGAALGAYAWPLSRLCVSCIAFEPNPDQARYLRQAFGSKIRVDELALSDHEGDIELLIPQGKGNDLAGQATIAPIAWMKAQNVRRVRVAMRTLDGIALDPVGFVKLDVEGHELAVLRGARALIARDRPTIMVELEERFGEGSVARVREFLEPQGYRGVFLDSRHLRPVASFDPGRHQVMAECGNLGIYINNFIFLPEERQTETHTRLSRLGYAVAD